MKAQGREHAEWGFKMPEDGWHRVEMLEGIDYFKKEGEVQTDRKGEKTWLFPAKISDETDPSDGIRVNQFIYESDFGEQKIADILAGIGEMANFEKAFPGERSFFESAIMDKIKIKVPGKFLKMRTELSKDGKNVNFPECANLKYNPEENKKTGAKGKGKEKADDKTTGAGSAAPQTGNDW